MKKGTRIYALLVGTLGLALGVLSCIHYFPTLTAGDGIMTFVVLSAIYVLCRCLPLSVSESSNIDMSFIALLLIILVKGPVAATCISFITTPFVITARDDGQGYRHIFNTDPIKSLFNMANLVITASLGGLMYHITGGMPGDITVPDILLPMISCITLAIISNSVIIMILFKLEQQVKFYPAIFQMFAQLLPSMACAAPVGYFLAFLMTQQSGAYLTLLFMLPLLLARYAFKLFLDGKQQQVSMISTLSAVIEAKDPYTQGHSQRVSEYSVQIAEHMGLPAQRIETLRRAALFHDIGKVGVGDSILTKRSQLTDEEWLSMRKHPQIAINILKHAPNTATLHELVLHHHEFYNGKGYPDGTQGDEMPLDVYILGISDAWDAMTSNRPYRNSMPVSKARDIIATCAGTQFHPQVAQVTVQMIDSGELLPAAASQPTPE